MAIAFVGCDIAEMLGSGPFDGPLRHDVRGVAVSKTLTSTVLNLFISVDLVGGKPGPYTMHYSLLAPNGAAVIPRTQAEQVWEPERTSQQAHVVLANRVIDLQGAGEYAFLFDIDGEQFRAPLKVAWLD